MEKIISSVIKLCEEVGEYIQIQRSIFDAKHIEYKDINNLVSYVDKEAEKKLIAGLNKINPKAGFITEEDTLGKDSEKDLNWIIDPLDGTANFIHGMPHYSISIGLFDGTEGLLGIVYDICRKEVYWAEKGKGTFKNKNRISVSKNKDFAQCLYATGFPYYKFEKMPNYLQILEELMKNTHGLRRAGSAALDLAYVAAGYFDGFFEYNLKSWDMAAGTLLVKEAGGLVSDFEGKENYLFGGDIIAASASHNKLLELISKHW